jgi:GNAT superfamily N-acetyltransferase
VTRITVRDAEADEIDQIAKVWFDSWRDAHEQIVPANLTATRTLESLRDRVEASLDELRVVGERGNPVGFALVKDDELYQLFVAAAARGTGVAAALIADAEERLADYGFRTAWLACAIGNDRAARFYEKQGWRRVGNMPGRFQTINGEMTLEVWRYEKDLSHLA